MDGKKIAKEPTLDGPVTRLDFDRFAMLFGLPLGEYEAKEAFINVMGYANQLEERLAIANGQRRLFDETF